MNEPLWIDLSLARAVHDRQIAEHGGGEGIRDESLLESALARPLQRYSYGDPPPDIAELAAVLAFGIAKNHPFVDGNKRTAAVLCELFIELNGLRLLADDAGMLDVFLRLAAGDMSEADMVDWLRQNIGPGEDDSLHEPPARYG